jgi:hypothetical protein
MTRRELRSALVAAAEGVLATRLLGALPRQTAVPLEDADDVILLCARLGGRFHAETYSQQLAFALELAARGRQFAVTEDPAAIFGKSVAWALPSRFVHPRLWNHARQVQQFAAGLELQGNRTFLSSHEAAFWENKAYMHRRLDEIGAATPETRVVTADTRAAAKIDFEPILVKEEHAAGSSGIHFFPTTEEAQRFLERYAYRPEESLIVQAVVRGANRDLRLTMVGDEPVLSATYWRIKQPGAATGAEWTTTATSFGATVVHAEPPPRAVELCARVLGRLGVRTAGFDLMWEGDDATGEPLILELSPLYQPNPPQPSGERRPYKAFKRRRYRVDGYFQRQHLTYRAIAAAILDKGLF